MMPPSTNVPAICSLLESNASGRAANCKWTLPSPQRDQKPTKRLGAAVGASELLCTSEQSLQGKNCAEEHTTCRPAQSAAQQQQQHSTQTEN
mmetsp:Transcript_63055/g.124680  ORF Transcript_63055/g.124680 Transcript_63055/m.124680 type:complete len:92 (+) Transcript_63055:109-384(+)